MRCLLSTILLLGFSIASSSEPLSIDPLWKSEFFRKTVTGSFGLDARIEPRITVDEEFYLEKSAKAMAGEDRKAAIKALADSPLLDESPAIQFNLANLQFEEGNLEKAVALFKSALTQFPNFRDAHRNLAIALLRDEKFEEAETHLIRSIELGSADGLTMGLLGYCHALKEHPQAALSAYRHASLTQPEERQWRIGEAQSLQALEQTREANAIFQELIDTQPQDLNLWRVQAEALISLNEPIEAIANLELAHRAHDLPATGILSLGHLYLQADLPELALERYEAAIDTEPPVALERILTAVEMLSNQRLFSATQSLIEKIELSNYDLTSGANQKYVGKLTRARALIELESGDAENGAKQLEAWLTKEPTDALALILLARFKEDSGLREEAEMLLEQAAEMPQHEAEALLAHGRLLTSIGDYASAVEKLERAARADPSERVESYLEAVRELAE
ncbi:MAG: tetratricopeptide repeat protein [Verrucomicrobiales bacterium]|nr:tetratricopeptide repeat protein [Verrucomicrobiales bacterium]